MDCRVCEAGGQSATPTASCPGPDVVNELEEPQVQRQALLRNPPMRTEPRTEQRPEPFKRVDMDLTEAIAVVIPGVLPGGMADRLVAVAPLTSRL